MYSAQPVQFDAKVGPANARLKNLLICCSLSTHCVASRCSGRWLEDGLSSWDSWKGQLHPAAKREVLARGRAQLCGSQGGMPVSAQGGQGAGVWKQPAPWTP